MKWRHSVMRRKITPLLIGMVLSLSACADKPYERIVVIDPGHGGVDPGAIGSAVLEKEVALRTGLALRDRLEATGRYRVIMTRDDDRFVELRDRLQIARQSRGELFVSLHADNLVSAPWVSGASVYTLSEPAANGAPALLAGKERPGEIVARVGLSSEENIAPENLIDLPPRDGNDQSIRLADLLVQELNGATRMAKRRPVQGGFVVLRSPEIPSVLVELGYLSNPIDERALANDAHIARLAAAVARAIDAYFGVGST
jgi:N-acetylmuramoyl-L-alanine amidase